jgi:hypothetical protein
MDSEEGFFGGGAGKEVGFDILGGGGFVGGSKDFLEREGLVGEVGGGLGLGEVA